LQYLVYHVGSWFSASTSFSHSGDINYGAPLYFGGHSPLNLAGENCSTPGFVKVFDISSPFRRYSVQACCLNIDKYWALPNYLCAGWKPTKISKIISKHDLLTSINYDVANDVYVGTQTLCATNSSYPSCSGWLPIMRNISDDYIMLERVITQHAYLGSGPTVTTASVLKPVKTWADKSHQRNALAIETGIFLFIGHFFKLSPERVLYQTFMDPELTPLLYPTDTEWCSARCAAMHIFNRYAYQ
jgi:hypothetical protein